MFLLFLQEIASEVQSETKWKQLGELAMSNGKVFWLPLIVYWQLIAGWAALIHHTCMQILGEMAVL